MALFQINKDKLRLIKEDKFKLEKEIQKLTEDNLQGCVFVGFIVRGFFIFN